jgi:AraC-like DNA-binding protein
MRSTDAGTLEQIAYRPPGSYRLDLEIMPISELQRRGSPAHFRRPQRLAQFQVIAVLEGQCTHMADFVQHSCTRRTWLLLRPGQVQRFDFSRDWQGWLMVFRPEFLPPLPASVQLDELGIVGRLDNLPDRLDLSEYDHDTALAAMLRMYSDTQIDAAPAELNSLLRHQLYALLERLYLTQGRTESFPAIELRRFRRFRQAVEAGFRQTRHLGDYARHLGCSEKSLSRACRQIAGISAKAWLSRRIALEARRMLVHTALPVQAVASGLGFDEASNFVKFFRRECGCPPGAFRTAHLTGPEDSDTT